MAKKSNWIYGKVANPKNWHEASDVLKQIGKKRKSGVGLMERLSKIEDLLKEKGYGN